MNTTTARQLLRIGRRSARTAAGFSTRLVALFLAAASLAFGLSVFAAIRAGYDGVDQRLEDRRRFAALVRAEQKKAEPALLARDGFGVTDGRQHSLIWVRPGTADPLLPPGVTALPGPGEAVLSPGLLEALTEEGARDRYGRVVGTIAPDGLANPGEHLGYAHPTDTQYNAEFMSRSLGDYGDPLWIQGEDRFRQLIYLLLAPAAVLTVVAARTGSASRDTRTALVSALGGRAHHRLLLHLGESAVPVAAGAVAGLLPAVALLVAGEIRLPYTGYRLSAHDLLRWWWTLPTAAAASVFVVLAAVCLLHRTPGRRTHTSTRLAARRPQLLRLGGWLCPPLLAVTVWVPQFLDPLTQGPLRDQIRIAGTVGVLLTLPCLIAVAAAAFGDRLATAAGRRGSAAALIAGRYAHAHPAQTARLVAGVAAALVVVTQVQLATSATGATTKQLTAVQDRIGSGVLSLSVHTHSLPREKARRIVGALELPAGTAVVAVVPTGNKGLTSVLQAPCPTLRSIRLDCGDGRPLAADAPEHVRLAAAWSSRTVPDSRTGTVWPDSVWGGGGRKAHEEAQLLLVSPDGSALPFVSLDRQLRAAVPTAATNLSPPGDEWLAGTRHSTAQGRWVPLFALPGVLMIAAAVMLANLAGFLRFGGALAPVSVLAGNRRVHRGAAAWALLAPMVATVVVSTVVAFWLAVPKELPQEGIELSPGLALSAAGALTVLAVVTWWWGSRSAIRQASVWQPSGG
ncbi:hypothetical protein ABZ930_15090 [Streptomyces sp. NPDC046716]|uniref:hypothetical protein n=1 Tax=Streptomyces sp. NPDC046716 TaxID=3157093 RepID=UPI00340CE3BC